MQAEFSFASSVVPTQISCVCGCGGCGEEVRVGRRSGKRMGVGVLGDGGWGWG